MSFCSTNVEQFRNVKQKGIGISFDFKTISFGFTNKGIISSLKNSLIIFMKYFIFQSKQRKEIPKFLVFLTYLKAGINIEKEIAIIYWKNRIP